MNILHHKSWHVRNKDNIARVRKDEAKAAEEERKKQEQVNRAEQEVRIKYLRSKNRTESSNNEETEELDNSTNVSTNFNDIKKNITHKSNKDYENEKKEEKEKYEKQIGCLTYLGQCKDNNVTDGNLKSWYDLPPKNRYSQNSSKEDDNSSSLNVKDDKIKEYNDPLKYYFKDKTIDREKQNKNSTIKHEKKKKDKKEKLSKKDMLKKLRKERLIREAKEKERQNKLLAKSIAID